MCFRFSNWGKTKNRIQLIGREDLSKHRIILPQWFKVGKINPEGLAPMGEDCTDP